MRSKYKAQPQIIENVRFASKKEANRFSELRLLERAGHIVELTPHPKFKFEIDGIPVLIKSKGFPNGRQASYTADFSYVEVKTGELILEDTKGMDTSESRLRRAIVEAMWPDLKIRVL